MNPISNLLIGIGLLSGSLATNYIVLGGMGLFSIIIGIFEIKKYNNEKLLLVIAALILSISLILTYFQQSSTLYSVDTLINYILAIFFALVIIMGAYDITHNYKISKNMQMNNLSQSRKDIIAIVLLLAGLIFVLLMGIFL